MVVFVSEVSRSLTFPLVSGSVAEAIGQMLSKAMQKAKKTALVLGSTNPRPYSHRN
jgi:hypothetical protein